MFEHLTSQKAILPPTGFANSRFRTFNNQDNFILRCNFFHQCVVNNR